MFANTLINSHKISTKLSYLYAEINPVNFCLFLVLMITYLILMGTVPKFYIFITLILVILDNASLFVSRFSFKGERKGILKHIPFNIWLAFLWILLCLGLTIYKFIGLVSMFFNKARYLQENSNNLFIYHPGTSPLINALCILLPELILSTVLLIYMMTNVPKLPIKSSNSKELLDIYKNKKVSLSKYMIDILIFASMAISLNIFTLTFAGLYIISSFKLNSHKKLFQRIFMFGVWINSIAAIVVPITIVNYDLAYTFPSRFYRFLGLFNLISEAGHLVISIDFTNKHSYQLILIFGLFYLSTKNIGRQLTRMGIKSSFLGENTQENPIVIMNDMSITNNGIFRNANNAKDQIQIELNSEYMDYFIRKIGIIMKIESPEILKSSKYLKKIAGLDFKYFNEAFQAHQKSIGSRFETKFEFFNNCFLFFKNHKINFFSFIHVCAILVIVNYLQNLYTLLFLIYVLLVILNDLKSHSLIQYFASWILRITTVLCFIAFLITNTEMEIFSDSLKSNFLFNLFGFHFIEESFLRILIIFLLMTILRLNYYLSLYSSSFVINDMLKKYFEMSKKSIWIKILQMAHYPSRVIFYSFLIFLEFINNEYNFFRLICLVLFLISINLHLQRKENFGILKLLIYFYMIIRFIFFFIFQAKLLNQGFSKFFEIFDEGDRFFSSNIFNLFTLIILGTLIKLILIKKNVELNIFEDETLFVSKSKDNRNNILYKGYQILNLTYAFVKPFIFYLVILIAFAVIQINLFYVVLFFEANILLFYEEANYFFLLNKNQENRVKSLKKLVLIIFYSLIVLSIIKLFLYLFM